MKKVSTKLLLPLLMALSWQMSIAQIACNADTYVSTDPATGLATITAEMILAGGPYDYSIMELSQSEFGIGDYEVTVTETTTNNICWGQVHVRDGSIPTPLTCNDMVYVSTEPWACQASISADMLLEGGPYDYSVMEVSPDLITGDDLGNEVVVTVTETTTGNTCWGTVTLDDKTPPVAVTVQNLVGSLNDACVVKIYALDVDNGSYDGCSDVTLSPEFWEFGSSDVGLHELNLTVTDEFGNSNQIWSNVSIEIGNCVPGLARTYPQVNLSIAGTDTIFLSPEMFFQHPQPILGGYAILPEFVTVDDLGITEVTMIAPDDATYTSDLLLCSTNLFIQECSKSIVTINSNQLALTDISNTLTDIDDSCTEHGFILSFSGTDNAQSTLVSDCSDLGTSNVSIYLWSGNVLLDECVTILQVLDGAGYCDGISTDCEESDINEPEQIIEINSVVSSDADISPETLMNVYGFDEEQVLPTFSDNCQFVSNYYDLLIVAGPDQEKVIRTFTVFDWDDNTSWEYEQIIKVFYGGTSSSLACNDHVNVSVTPWGCSAVITAEMLLAGGPYDYSNMLVTLKDENGVIQDLPQDQVPKGTYLYEVTDTSVNNTCWGTLLVEDKTPPVAIALANIVIALTYSPNDPTDAKAKLYADQVDNGSHDGDCGPVKLVPPFWEFGCGDVGLNEITLGVWDDADGDGIPGSSAGDNYNETWTVVEVEIKNGVVVQCPEDIIVSCDLNVNDDAVIENTLGKPEILQACQSALEYSDKVGFDLNDDGDLDDVIVLTNGLDISEAYNPCVNYAIERTWSLGDVECQHLIYVERDNGFDPATIIWPGDITTDCESDLVEPKWDDTACSLVGYAVESDTFLFTGDACRKIVNNWTVIDWCAYDPTDPGGSGLYSHTSIQRVEDSILPYFELPDDFTINCKADQIDLSALAYDQCEIGNLRWNISIDYNNDFVVEDDILVYQSSGDNVDITLTDAAEGIHRIVWLITDACGNTVSETRYVTVQVSAGDDTEAPTPYCFNVSTAVLTDGMIELWAIDLDAGSFDNCTPSNDLRFTFDDVTPENNPEFDASINSSSRIFDTDDLDANGFITVGVYVWDLAGNVDFCLTNIQVVNGNLCSESDVSWPLEIIEVNTVLGNQSPEAVASPEDLVDLFGYSVSDVRPIMPSDCDLLSSYSDQVIDVLDGNYKIIRTWVVLNWLTADTYEFIQIIKIFNEPSFICDFLPNTAPVGDCQSGHSLEDDVEWPTDIIISDHRISPGELEEFSSVPTKDTRPIFYNSPSLYTAIYEDFVEDLTTTHLTIKRRWSVNRQWVTGYVWNYDQLITIDLAELAGLVSVNTMNNRPIPGVQLTTQVMTDGSGIGVVEETDIVTPYRSEDALNGINIKDVHLIRNHILGLSLLDAHQKIAADHNGEGTITGADIVDMKNIILGHYKTDVEWRFIEVPPISGLPTKGQYIGIKPGDVDDSAVLTGTPYTYDETDLSYKDVLINKGQAYSLDLNYSANKNVWAMEVRMDYVDTDIVITNVTSEVFPDIQFNAENGKLTIVALSPNGILSQLDGKSSMSIEFDALENTTLSTSLEFSSEDNSFILDSDETLLVLNGEIEDKLSTGVQDTEFGLISIYPNPVTEVLFINVEDSYTEDYKVQLFDMAGKTVRSGSNLTQVNVFDLDQGYYIIQISLLDRVYQDKIAITR